MRAIRLLRPEIALWLLFAHAYSEPGHALVLQKMRAKPLLNLGVRLGEGSGGGALAVLILRLA